MVTMSDSVKVKYVGPFAEGVIVPDHDENFVFPVGEAVEVGLELARALVPQSVWEPADKKSATLLDAEPAAEEATDEVDDEQPAVDAGEKE